MIEKVLERGNLNRAYQKVYANKGAGGVDGLEVSGLKDYLRQHGAEMMNAIRSGSYQPKPIRGIEIPKSNGKKRLLGVPTVADRVIQQAHTQVLEPLFEPDFRPFSYGFRPNRNAQQAVLQSQKYINEGYQYVVDIDLKSFFDEVDHSLLLELIYRKVKCRQTLQLLRRFMRVPIQIEGKLQKRRKGGTAGRTAKSPAVQYSTPRVG